MQYNQWLDAPIFLCGHPKSGTTLLTSLLDNHPQLLVIPEETKFYHRFLRFNTLHDLKKTPPSLFFSNFMKKVENYSDLYKFNKEKTEDSIGGNYDYTEIDYTLYCNHVEAYLNEHEFTNSTILKSFAYALDQCINTPEISNKIKHWVEKTPYNEYYIQQILTDFPEAKFIHIIRDPRDNWVSYKKKRPVLRMNAYCRNWEKAARIALQKSQRYPEKHIVLFYEDLVLNQEKNIQKVVDFLGIEKTNSLFIPSKLGKAWHGNSMWGNRDTSINPNAISRYKNWPKQSDIQEIESCLRPYFKTLNYSASLPDLPQKRLRYTYFKISRFVIDFIKSILHIQS